TARWGAYATTEPGCGSDVAAMQTTCRKDGDHYVLNGRKCFITNGARASWVVIFATIDPALGRAGQRSFVVEKGTPGFTERKIDAGRLLCWNAAYMADAGQTNSKEASMAKAYCAKVGQWVTSKAMELMGGFGCVRERYVEKLYRDIKVYDIFEGTGEVQRLVISRRLMPDIQIP